MSRNVWLYCPQCPTGKCGKINSRRRISGQSTSCEQGTRGGRRRQRARGGAGGDGRGAVTVTVIESQRTPGNCSRGESIDPGQRAGSHFTSSAPRPELSRGTEPLVPSGQGHLCSICICFSVCIFVSACVDPGIGSNVK